MFVLPRVILLASALTTVSALGPSRNQIKALVTFGDSYTDVVSVLPFMVSIDPEVFLQVSTGDNATAWPVFAAEDGHFQLHPFARSGATCSNNLTDRPFPSVFESQLPLFFTERRNGSLRLNMEETMFTLWIGTNDVGAGALLTGHQTPGVTVVDTVSCAVNWVKVLYESGARNFIFQNVRAVQEKGLKTYPCYHCR